jgi:hypothetical protein
MTVEEIMQYRRANPFKPFILQLKDGREFVIRRPEEIGRDTRFTRVHYAADEESGDTARIEDVAGVKLLRKSRTTRKPKGKLK